MTDGVGELRVVVAAHKEFDPPKDEVYVPVQVGRARSRSALPFIGDDSGDNISHLNPSYCELTALYWAWKNLDCDSLGLAHYRRYFRGESGGPATGDEMAEMLRQVDVVVAKRRNYVIQSVGKQYANSHHRSDLDAVRQVLAQGDPSYREAFDRVMAGTKVSLYNMFLMRRPLVDAYCSWLFEVLGDVQLLIPLDAYGPQQARVMGYLGERLLNVWLAAEPSLRVARSNLYAPESPSTLVAGSRMVGRMVGIGRAE